MPAAAFSIGRDVSLTIYTSAGIISTSALKSFEAKPIQPEVKQDLITSEMLSAYLFAGWEGSFTMARVDSSIDDFFANAEASYYAGNDLISAQISETITNPDQSTSQFIYTKAALKLDDPGSWAANKEVDVKINFMASRRIGL